jgi:hypothetical protein
VPPLSRASHRMRRPSGTFDEWAKRAPARLGNSVARREKLYPNALLHRSRCYNDFLLPFDVCQTACIGSAGAIGPMRPSAFIAGPNEDSFRDELIAALQMLFNTFIGVPRQTQVRSASRQPRRGRIGARFVVHRHCSPPSGGALPFHQSSSTGHPRSPRWSCHERGSLSAPALGDSSSLRQLVDSLTGRAALVTPARNALLISSRKDRRLQLQKPFVAKLCQEQCARLR